jgi:hypothetical protein
MKTIAVGAALALGLLAGPGTAASPIELPTLTRIASKLSGLQSERRVTVVTADAATMRRQATRLLDRDYPADQQAYDETIYRALGLLKAGEPLRPALLARSTSNVLGLYDPVSGTLYVRSGTQRRAALLHELVHALQDQAFNLRRLSALRRGDRDAAAAAAAAVEGDAQWATQLVGGAGTPSLTTRLLASHSSHRIDLFLELEQQFPYTTGLRFVANLHNLGGNKAVFTALRQFPTTSEQIFHIDAFLAREPAQQVALLPAAGGLSLQRADTFGELDVRALLAVFQVPRLDHVGEGWGGGRTAIYGDAAGHKAVAVVVNWDTDLDAAEWGEAVATYVNEAFEPDIPGFPATTPCGSATCWSVAGRQIAFVRNGERTALVFGDSAATAGALAASLAGAP